ncbi:unnamed protein product [Didymodactylos carnosus]|uniref:Uncharacterized protein n=1 Tax=Didymodactylos carnosus TaxID=1234261 RepID=A0A8S2KSH2_9BILA|nr:unnamed protein product [Didymodactylos carnosus]CAF3862402.1 unnamed protein product [Didymodactylos carnosus]
MGGILKRLCNSDGFTADISKQIYECVRGDMYIVDQARTKGHVAMLNSGCWNPKDLSEFMTCSNDGTIRLWSAYKRQQQTCVIKTKSEQGKKVSTTTCTYHNNHHSGTSNNTDLITAGCDDGSIQIWDRRRPFVNVTFLCRHALRDNLHNRFPMTDIAFSPDDRYLTTGTSTRKKTNNNESDETNVGKLYFFNRQNLEEDVCHLQVSDSASVIRTLWSPKLNQIFCTTSNDRVRNLSVIRMKQREDPVKSKRPDLPMSGVGQGGRLGAHSSTLSGYIVKNIALQKLPDQKEDPRAALLKYAEISETDPYWVAPAYKQI